MKDIEKAKKFLIDKLNEIENPLNNTSETFVAWVMCEYVKELEAKNNESLHFVSHCKKCKQPLKGEKISPVGYNICTCNWDTSNCG